jgi:hypothetical protein
VANAAGFIQESIWRDGHWRKLSRTAQALYMQLLSQKELDCAGILPLQPNKWAKGCDGLTAAQVWQDLEELQDHRFVFYDVDTDELLIRTYVRNSNVVKIPNMRRSAKRAALLVGSAVMRKVLAEELLAAGHEDFAEIVPQLDPSLTVPETVPVTVNPTLPEPLTEPTGVGVGVGVGVTLVCTHLGEPPTEFCSEHPSGTTKPCRGCAKSRESFGARMEAWKAGQSAERQRAVDNCGMCDDDGWIELSDNSVRKCDHA